MGIARGRNPHRNLCRRRRQGKRGRQDRLHRWRRRGSTQGKKRREEEKEEKPKAEEEEKKAERSEEGGEAERRNADSGREGREKGRAAEGEKKAEPEKPAPNRRKAEEARVKASPVARRIAAELGVDLSSVKGTGPEGRVTETDVRACGEIKIRELRRPKVRRRLQGWRKRAHSTFRHAQNHCRASGRKSQARFRIFISTSTSMPAPLMEARAELKSAGEGADAAKITVNDFVLKAAVQAAVKVPQVNASFDGDAIVQYADVDLGIAVAIEDGLVDAGDSRRAKQIAARDQ